MRTAAITAIYEAAKKDPRIYFLSGDFGKAYLDMFVETIPAQCINMGMAEQNMIGVAAGLALSGMKVFVYSIVPFVTLRCLEQIKLDVTYHNLDVTIIGVGAGLVYGTCGPTHYAIEELGALRSLPNMKIVVPATPYEARLLTEEIIRVGGPAYLRLNKVKEPNLEGEYKLQVGKAHVAFQTYMGFRPVTLITTGAILPVVIETAKLLEQRGHWVEVLNMHTVKPIDREAIMDRINDGRSGIFTIEEHSVIGGLGSAVAEIAAESYWPSVAFKRFGIPDVYPEVVGTQQFLREHFGLSPENLAKNIVALL